MEDVDRKTAAAAYRRLQKEQLVRVEPRSGVYLERDAPPEDGAGPLQRLHRQWLEQALSTATELGLTSDDVARMLQGVAVVESHRIPVVDEDRDHAELLARELASRTGLEYGACLPSDLPAQAGPLKDAPFVVSTPEAALRLRPAQRRVPVVPAILAASLLEQVRLVGADGAVTVVVGTAGLESELARALDHGLIVAAGAVSVVRPAGPEELARLDAARIVVWPGLPARVREGLDGRHVGSAMGRLLSDGTVREIRQQVARAALDYVSRSIAV